LLRRTLLFVSDRFFGKCASKRPICIGRNRCFGANPLRAVGLSIFPHKGGFGLVCLAHDEQLKRLVAIKVPHSKLISEPEDTEAYLTEARTVHNLDHPGIVPVHDVGSKDDGPCYVVSKAASPAPNGIAIYTSLPR
jgi:hypothetical protein